MACNAQTSNSETFSIREITTIADFMSMKSAWNEVAKHHNSDFPFLCHEWFELWLNHFLSDNKLLIILVTDAEQIVTIAPFIISEKFLFPLSAKKLELIGNAYSPIRSFIHKTIDDETRKLSLESIVSHLYHLRRMWDILDLAPFSEDCRDFVLLKEIITHRGCSFVQKTDSVNWYIDNIDFSGEQYISSRSKNIRKWLRKRREELEKVGDVEFRVILSPDNMDRHMDLYYSIYASSWKKQERIGPNFHRDLAKLAAAKGWLRLTFLYVDNTPIATQFSIFYNGHWARLKTAYDETFKTFGPGVLILAETMRYAIDQDNSTNIDFGPGNEPYKKSWASHKRDMQRLMVFNTSAKGCCLAFIKTRISPVLNKHQFPKKIRAFFGGTATVPLAPEIDKGRQ